MSAPITTGEQSVVVMVVVNVVGIAVITAIVIVVVHRPRICA